MNGCLWSGEIMACALENCLEETTACLADE
jgi:hypothetical protein